MKRDHLKNSCLKKNLYRIKLIIIGNAITAYHLTDGKNYFTSLNEKNIADNKHF